MSPILPQFVRNIKTRLPFHICSATKNRKFRIPVKPDSFCQIHVGILPALLGKLLYYNPQWAIAASNIVQFIVHAN